MPSTIASGIRTPTDAEYRCGRSELVSSNPSRPVGSYRSLEQGNTGKHNLLFEPSTELPRESTIQATVAWKFYVQSKEPPSWAPSPVTFYHG